MLDPVTGTFEELPQMEMSATISGTTLTYLPPVKIDATLHLDKAMLDINQAACTSTFAFNGGQPEERVCPASSMAFFPKGSEIYIKTDNPMPGLFLAFNNFAVAWWLKPLGLEDCLDQIWDYKTDPTIGFLAQAALQEFSLSAQEERASDELLMESIIIGITSRLIYRISSETGKTVAAPSKPAHDIAEAKINRAKSFIADRLFDQELKVADIASSVGWSTPHFAKQFKTRLGVSPYNYILTSRVERAKRMLLETPKTLTEVAFMSGFYDQAHMTSTFTRILGQTPLKVRKESYAEAH